MAKGTQHREEPRVTEALQQDAQERLNNAIAQIDWIAQLDPNVPVGTKRAIRDMTTHWAAFWKSEERKLLPNIALQGKLERYVKWYTRAWVLVPQSVQAQVVRPDQIDVQWSKLALDSVANWNEGARETLEKGGNLAEYYAKGAAALAARAGSAVAQGLSDLAWIAIAGLVGYHLLKRK